VLTLAVLRAHWRDHLATLLALTFGVAISAASLLVFTSARPEVPARFAAAEILVQSPVAGEDEESYPEYLPWTDGQLAQIDEALQNDPAVRRAVPVRTFYAQLVVDGRPVGTPDAHDPEGRSWSAAALAPYRITSGRAPESADEIAVSRDYGLRAGDRVALLTGPGRRDVTVSGTVGGPGIYLSDREASKLAAAPTLVGLLLAPGTDVDAAASRLRATLPPDGSVLAGDDRAEAEPEGVARTRYLGTQLLTVMVVLACFAATFVVSQTFSLATAHRRRDVGLLRTLGATPGQVARLTVLEAAAVGVVGAVLGGGLGTAISPLLGRLLVAAGLEPTGFRVVLDPVVLLGVVLLGPCIAVGATWAGGRRAGRTSPLNALGTGQFESAGLGKLRTGAGLVAGLGAATAVVAAATSDPADVAMLATLATLGGVAAVTLLAPIVLPPLVRLATWPMARSRGATAMLARGALTSAVTRTTSTMAPVLATLAFATLVLGYTETGREAYGTGDLPPDASVVVAPQGTPGLTEDTVTAVRRSGTDVEAPLPTQVFLGDPATAAEAVGLTSVPAGTALVGVELAERNGWHAGDTITVTTADGERTQLRIGHVTGEDSGRAEGETASSNGNGAAGRPAPAGPATAGEGAADDADVGSAGISGDGPALGLPREFVRSHDPSALTTRLMPTDVTPDRLRQVSRPGVRVLPPTEYARVAEDSEYRLFRLFVLVMLGLALGYTTLSVANTLVMATAARAGDLRLLRLAGATPRQVLSSVSVEALTTVAIGSIAGIAAGLAGVLGIRSGLARELGRDVPVVVPWGLLGGLVAICAALATAAAFWPAWNLVRRSPASTASGTRE
jgi:putative ABC transport system permease protein